MNRPPTRRGLEAAGVGVTWRAYEATDHELSEKSVGDLAGWIEARLAPQEPPEPKEDEGGPDTVVPMATEGGGGEVGQGGAGGAKGGAAEAGDAKASSGGGQGRGRGKAAAPLGPRPSPSSDAAAQQAAAAQSDGPPCVPFKIGAARGGGYNMHTASFQVRQGRWL